MTDGRTSGRGPRNLMGSVGHRHATEPRPRSTQGRGFVAPRAPLPGSFHDPVVGRIPEPVPAPVQPSSSRLRLPGLDPSVGGGRRQVTLARQAGDETDTLGGEDAERVRAAGHGRRLRRRRVS